MICELVRKIKLAADVYDFTVVCPEMAKMAKAGQFVHVLCGGDAYLRRPISICDVIEERLIRFVFQVRGIGTEELAKCRMGEKLDILGPLGNGFDLAPVGEGATVLLGGGIGVFPLLRLAKDLNGRATVLLGFRNKGSVLMADEFSRAARSVFVATDDGSCGYHGFVTDILRNILQSNKVARIYTCGPTPMMRLASQIGKECGVPVQASLEERMGCGVGACVTCTCTVGGNRRRVCKDGPVFDGWEVEWDV